MKASIYTPLYAVTLILSAALLFSVQPMFSKFILPLLGGTSQVWNTAMLFFQVTLLAGYGYAHVTSKFLNIKAQAILHFILLALFTVVLPFGIPEGWTPPKENDPTFWQLSLMSVTVGGPFFVLAASAPMLQRWFSYTDHPDADDPYFLYGASNLGSMSSLLLYPILIEPLLTLSGQANMWMFGYIGLGGLIVLAALIAWPHAGRFFKTQKRSTQTEIQVETQPLSWRTRFEWLFLAFVPSSLMLGVTTYITTDIASAPLIWIVPLALYVGTFILVFARKELLSIKNLLLVQGLLISSLVFFSVSPSGLNNLISFALNLVTFFFTAWMCHAILAAKRPSTTHLTEFYLLISTGGALGGFFNAIIAPQIFTSTLEYPLVLVLACLCRLLSPQQKTLKAHWIWGVGALILTGLLTFGAQYAVELSPLLAVQCTTMVVILCLLMLYRNAIFAGMVAIGLLVPSTLFLGSLQSEIIHRERNFFGTIAIFDVPERNIRIFLHGRTNHGTQPLQEDHKFEMVSYYSKFSPLRQVVDILDAKPPAPQNVAVVGLGAGVSSCFTRENRHFDFFEIDPAVARIAENPELFTYLSGCGSPYEIILGDARLTLQEKPNERYDLILIDAFSSDNIPVHLLTKEALEIYLSKLKKDGILAMHISNKFLNLEPVLAAAGLEMGLEPVSKYTTGGTLESGHKYYPSHYIVMTKSDDVVMALRDEQWLDGMVDENIKSWTDQFSNMISVIGKSTVYKHAQIQEEAEKSSAEEVETKEIEENEQTGE